MEQPAATTSGGQSRPASRSGQEGQKPEEPPKSASGERPGSRGNQARPSSRSGGTADQGRPPTSSGDKADPARPSSRQSQKVPSDGDEPKAPASGERRRSVPPSRGSADAVDAVADPQATLSLDELKAKIRSSVDELTSYDGYGTAEAVECMKFLADSFTIYIDFSTKIGDFLAETQFPELSVRIKKWFNADGKRGFTPDARETTKEAADWMTIRFLLLACWNYTDRSIALSKRLIDTGYHRLLVGNLRHRPYLNSLSDKRIFLLIKSSMVTIFNMSKVTEYLDKFREVDAVEAIEPYIKFNDEYLKVAASLTISFLVDEKRNQFIDRTGSIPKLIEWLKEALSSEKRSHRGFSPLEITSGLGRLAVNDKNKEKIIGAKMLPLLVAMLQDEGHKDEQAMACEVIWQLSFNLQVKGLLRKDDALIAQLEKLSTTKDEVVKRRASGALWEIVGHEKRKESGDVHDGHIMISYNWDHQKKLIEVRDRLKGAGCKLWMDIDNMGNDIIDSMAGAVEGAAVVLVCVSEKYKLSANCQSEAKYAFKLKKPVIFLLMQPDYRPDGWLGLLMGDQLFINFTGRKPFDESYRLLFERLDKMLNPRDSQRASQDTLRSTISLKRPEKPSQCGSWDTEKVSNWLRQNQLEKFTEKLATYSGKHLQQMTVLRKEAPEYFYKSLTDIGMDFEDVLHFMMAMDALQ